MSDDIVINIHFLVLLSQVSHKYLVEVKGGVTLSLA